MYPRLRLFVPLSVVLLAIGCERAQTPPAADTSATAEPPRAAPTTRQAPPPPAPAPAAATIGWDTAAGPVLVVHDSAAALARLVFPRDTESPVVERGHVDRSLVEGHAFELFGRGGRVGSVRLGDVAVREGRGAGCAEWPTASLQPVTPVGDVPPAWSVAFEAGRVRPIALDSLGALSRTDSAYLAAEITRLAAALPGDTANAFRGVPFAVNDAYRFAPVAGVRAVVAEVERRLNQEANPLEQQILLVAEHDSTVADDGLHTVYFERRSGSEEALETFDVLAAIVLPDPPRPTLVLVRAGPTTSAYALLERSSSGRWSLRWTSARAGC
jgi:hypothetical protein